MSYSFTRFFFLLLSFLGFLSLRSQSEIPSPFLFQSSDNELQSAVQWAKEKALSYAHDDSDPVGFWYEAALPNREAFCMRDVSHQSVGAEILGLSKHNRNMLLKFAQNISESKDYASYWEINRYNQPAPVDYESDRDFWYNLPANFDLIFTMNRLFEWTQDSTYIEHPSFQKFCSLSLNEYVDRWALSHDVITTRDRSLFVQDPKAFPKNRFGKNRGIPTYNEGGRGESLLGIDMTASYIAGLKSYIEILNHLGRDQETEVYAAKLTDELHFLNTFWWDASKKVYRSIYYQDQSFDYFMVGKDQAYLHYLLYFDVLSKPSQINTILNEYRARQQSLIIELKSYLPILFYEKNEPATATKIILELCDEANTRRDYPENSFTVIEHVTRGLMGINPSQEAIATQSRLEASQWAKVEGVSIFGTQIDVEHHSRYKTVFSNKGNQKVLWKAMFEGEYDRVWVDNKILQTQIEKQNGSPVSFVFIPVNEYQEVTVAVED